MLLGESRFHHFCRKARMMRVRLPLPSDGAVGKMMAATETDSCPGRICYCGPFALINGDDIDGELNLCYQFDPEMRAAISNLLRKNMRRKAIFCGTAVFELIRPCAEFFDRQHPDCARSFETLFYCIAIMVVYWVVRFLEQTM